MFKLEKASFWKVGLYVAALTFILLFVGIRVIASIVPVMGNYMAYAVFSLLVGGIASVLVHFRLKIALVFYLVGLLVGFFLMYKAFLYDMSGWGDLVGVISLMMFTGIGLAAGLLIQLVNYLFKRYKKA